MKKLLFTSLFGALGASLAFSQGTCNTAININAGVYTTATISGTEVPAPNCAGGANATAGKWYKYTPTQDYTVTVTSDFTENAGVDNIVHIYSGTCGALTCVTGDDDSGTNYLFVVSFQATAGVEYKIAFDNQWSASGFKFEVIETPPVIPNPNEITFTPQGVPSITGDYKVAVADMNGDNMDDIVSVSSTNVQIHYQQVGGGFNPVNIATSAATNLPSWSMAIADYNKDGYGDLLYGGGNGVTFMRSSNNGTQYTQITGNQYVFSQRSNFVDFNNDGHLDAYVCHDVAPAVHYHNDGSGNLSFMQGGMGDHPQGGNYGSIFIDYDNDGDQDLFIAKCRGGENTAKINELHRNNGNGTFTNVSVAANMADPVQTWSSAWNDFDNDGYMDAIIGISSTSDGMHKVMHNNGDGTFSNVTAGSGWESFNHQSIEYVSYDMNNDGWADVFTDGHVMVNNGDGTFTDSPVSVSVGAVGDLNNDGFLDVQSGNTVYYNNGNDNNWTKLQLKGIQSNSNGIGARVEIYGTWGKQIRDVQSGIGFRHMGTMNVHFGIGTATEIDSIIVKWPSGQVDLICNPAINTPMLFVEGSGELPVADLSASATTVPEGTTVNMTDLSTICPNGWEWEVTPATGWAFANGTTANTQNPEITFNDAGTYTVSLTTSNSNGMSLNTADEVIIVTSTAGINEETNELISIYPNPTENFLTINYAYEVKISAIEIVSMTGALVKSYPITSNKLDVSGIKTGTYLLVVKSENGTKYTSRFVKK
ncbi:MAG: FG-GAP-like repeat-containing protein [Bacteroidota bacterium]